MRFERILVTVDDVTLSDDPDRNATDQSQTGPVVHGRAAGPWAVDVAKVGLAGAFQQRPAVGPPSRHDARAAPRADRAGPRSHAALRVRLRHRDRDRDRGHGRGSMRRRLAGLRGDDAEGPHGPLRRQRDLQGHGLRRPSDPRLRLHALAEGREVPPRLRHADELPELPEHRPPRQRRTPARRRSAASSCRRTGRSRRSRSTWITRSGTRSITTPPSSTSTRWPPPRRRTATLAIDDSRDARLHELRGTAPGKPLPWRSCIAGKPPKEGTRRFDPGSVAVDKAASAPSALRSYADYVRYQQRHAGAISTRTGSARSRATSTRHRDGATIEGCRADLYRERARRDPKARLGRARRPHPRA